MPGSGICQSIVRKHGQHLTRGLAYTFASAYALALLHINAFLYLNQLPDVVKLFSDSIVLYIFVIYLHY